MRSPEIIGVPLVFAAVIGCAYVLPAPKGPPLPIAEVEERTPPNDAPPGMRIVAARDGGLTCFTPKDLAVLRERLEQCECPESR